jgi:indolepyruvate ferredoxin oxidoreductase beta subunit
MGGTKSILLIGVGGQGTILMSKILALGLTQAGYDVKMSEIHGMSQRGGSVTTQIKYGDKVYSPGIGLGEADIIVSFEKMEALRALPFLKKGGKLFTDDRELFSMPTLTGAQPYPHDAIDSVRASGADVTVVRGYAIAEGLGNSRAQNIVLLGALVRELGLDGIDWEGIVGENVPAKARELNLAGFREGIKQI